jgi:hypothetical protein
VLYNGQKGRNAVHSGVVRIPWQKLDKQHLALDAGLSAALVCNAILRSAP